MKPAPAFYGQMKVKEDILRGVNGITDRSKKRITLNSYRYEMTRSIRRRISGFRTALDGMQALTQI